MTKKTRPCEICGGAIEPERQDALPDTRLCVAHAREMEKYGGEFLTRLKQARLSKEGSLKKNYGDVSIQKKRNRPGLRRLKEEYQGVRDQANE